MNISRNYNRGKSFRFSEWCSGIVYKNDDFIQDFVEYKGVLYACVAPFTSKFPDKSNDWELVVDGVGATFIPHVDKDGNLTWTNDSNLDNPQGINLKGPAGDPGKDGIDGKDGVDGKDGKNGVDGKDGKDGKDGVDGKDGKNGVDGKDGKDGLSAYQIWLDAGNSGSELDFLNSLKGNSIEQTVEWGFWKN